MLRAYIQGAHDAAAPEILERPLLQPAWLAGKTRSDGADQLLRSICRACVVNEPLGGAYQPNKWTLTCVCVYIYIYVYIYMYMYVRVYDSV